MNGFAAIAGVTPGNLAALTLEHWLVRVDAPDASMSRPPRVMGICARGTSAGDAFAELDVPPAAALFTTFAPTLGSRVFMERSGTLSGLPPGYRPAGGDTWVLVAELSTDLSRFPSAAPLASWAGMCPGNHESAGKRQSGKTRKGNPYVRAALIEAAQAAGRKKGCYLAAQYRRLAHRRGKKKAAVAVGHSILVIAYHLLTRGTPYEELGGNYFDERDRQAVKRRLVQRLEDLGYEVTIQPATPAA